MGWQFACQIGPDSMIGEGSKMGERCSVKKSVIGSHCTIGKNVQISRSIIMDYVVIEDKWVSVCELTRLFFTEDSRVAEGPFFGLAWSLRVRWCAIMPKCKRNLSCEIARSLPASTYQKTVSLSNGFRLGFALCSCWFHQLLGRANATTRCMKHSFYVLSIF